MVKNIKDTPKRRFPLPLIPLYGAYTKVFFGIKRVQSAISTVLSEPAGLLRALGYNALIPIKHEPIKARPITIGSDFGNTTVAYIVRDLKSPLKAKPPADAEGQALLDAELAQAFEVPTMTRTPADLQQLWYTGL